MTHPTFPGFPPETLAFFRELATNNNRPWFQNRKDAYRERVVEPAQNFVRAFGERLRASRPHIQFDTSTAGSGSIMRIYRDTRFGTDKRPLKEHLGIVFWEGAAKKNENPGFYFHLDPKGTRLYIGMHAFPPDQLAAYRSAVMDDRLGNELATILNTLHKHYTIGGETYKSIPRGFDRNHPNAPLLKYSGLYAASEPIDENIVSSEKLMDTLLAMIGDTLPLHAWLVSVNTSH